MPPIDLHDHEARRSSPIYAYTKAKLLTHGVARSRDGRAALDDRQLFLLFVKLERAVRLADFAVVQARVAAIEAYLAAKGKRATSVFAYMYLFHNSMVADMKWDTDGNGRTTVVKAYRWHPSKDEIAIEEWTTTWLKRFGDRFRRVVYRSEID